MRAPHRIAVAALVSVVACLQPSEPGAGGLVLQFEGGAAVTAALTSGKVIAKGPTDLTVTVTPGTNATLHLRTGTYTIALEGMDSGGVARFYQTSGVTIAENQATTLTVPDLEFAPFVPAMNPLPSPSTSLSFTVSWGAMAGALSYEVEIATNETFTANRLPFSATGTSTTVTVPSGGTYYVRVRAIDAYQGRGRACASQTIQVTVSVTPAAPTNLTAATTSSSQINLSWTDNASNEDGFQIERCAGASCASFVQITTVGSNVTTYQNTGLTAATSYSYRVRAYNAMGNSGYSNTATATPSVTPPAAPTGLAAAVVSSSQINLSWTDNATNEDGFRIERCSGASCATFTELITVGSNVTTFQNIGLPSGTSYSYRVLAYNAGGSSGYSNTATAATSVTPPATPTNLTATVISSSQINLNWTDNASNETGFQIERCVGAACTTFTEIAPVGPNVTLYQSTGLMAGTSYSYRVWAYNGAGSSAYSNTATAVTILPAPSGLAATVISTTQINLSWTDNSPTEDGFRIERCSGAPCGSFTQIATVGPNVTTYQNTGLTVLTTYSYRVLAYNTAGSSAYSNTATAVLTVPVYVVNSSPINSIMAYAPGASGNATPTATIAGGNTGLSGPQGIALNGAGNIYVTNYTGLTSFITVYAAGASGNATPTATISGSNTGLGAPLDIDVDGVGNIYVANGVNSITRYAAGASGNATPTATIAGSNTGLNGTIGMALDGAGKIYVINTNNSITVYAAGASGNATPTATIAGSNTGLNSPHGIDLDGTGKIYVANTNNTITVYAAGASGNATPTATIAGSNTGLNFPVGIALDGSGNIYVGNLNGNSITVFAAGASGNATPIATITGSNTGLIRIYAIALKP